MGRSRNLNHYIIVFDIGNPKLYRYFKKMIKKYGVPFQHSVFEIFVNTHELSDLTKQIEIFYKKHFRTESREKRLFRIAVIPQNVDYLNNSTLFGCSFFNPDEDLII